MKRLFAAAIILIIAALSIGAAGCAPRDGGLGDTSELAGSSWHLASYESGFWQLPLIPFTKITLVFDESAGVVRGNAGCNLYGADFSITNDNLTISRLTQTLMTRPLPLGVMQQERQYLKLLGASKRIAVSGDRLTIYCSGSIELRFRRD